MVWNIVIVIVALCFCALFSGYEMAFLHCNRLKVALDKKEGKKYAIAMDRFINNEGDLISSLLMGNNIFVVIYSIAAARLLNPFLTAHITTHTSLIIIIETIVATLIVMITAEYLPKALCLLNANKVFSSLYRVILFFYHLFYPLTWLTNRLAYLIIGKKMGQDIHPDSQEAAKFDTTDLMNLSEEVEDAQGDDVPSDIEIFQNAMDFSQTKIKECLIPRTEIVAIDIEDSIEELLSLFVDTGYSRIIVYRETLDDIIGYVLSKDLLTEGKKSIKEILRPITHVPMDMDARTLLEKMTSRKENIVAVSDEYGGTEGIITLEDLIEEIFGEIDDELDRNEFVEKKISDKEWVFSARLDVKDINRRHELSIPEDDAYETLAGLILYNLGFIPKEKETFRIGNISFTILKTSKKRIETVSLKIHG
ncbi:MAG: HlyC/CorC family transporter [Bacteroidales bacterium]|nr:HlyC/CorC family transporter [Bacteroidales bacterium]